MVWSDPEILKLTREFVTVAEEVHFLYPEDRYSLDRLANNPAHLFFKRYGEAMPESQWNHPGTKQGIYMIGPDAEYLEGGGAISGGVDDMRNRLRAALERWKTISKAKKYANQRVPRTSNITVPDAEEKRLVFRVFLRDLPRGERDSSGRRFAESDLRGIWPDFTQWAWNVNWITFDDPTALIPKGKEPQAVKSELFRKICREALVDNVRGQNPHWEPTHVKVADLSMRALKKKSGRVTIEYVGRAEMDSGRQKYTPRLYGQSIWNIKKRRFDAFHLVAIGDREGAGTFNQRSEDRGPAPMGVVLSLFQPEPEKKRRRR